MADDPDDELVLRARDGDDDAFAALVARHRATAVAFVARRCGRPDLAEDAVQEALVAAHKALATGGDPPDDVRAWLSTIAWRRALNLMRSERSAVPLDPGAPSRADGPDTLAIRATELDRVLATWAGLPERQRQALVLSVLEGRSLREIGDRLDVAPDAAKSLVARSRRTLVHRLGPADGATATAAERCDDLRDAILGAALRGVRLDGRATRHVRECPACHRLHRHARRRRRWHAVILAPALLVQRGREVIVAMAGEPATGLAAKMCAAAACVTVAAAPVAVTGGGDSGGAIASTATEDDTRALASLQGLPREAPRFDLRPVSAATSSPSTRPAPTAVPMQATGTPQLRRVARPAGAMARNMSGETRQVDRGSSTTSLTAHKRRGIFGPRGKPPSATPIADTSTGTESSKPRFNGAAGESRPRQKPVPYSPASAASLPEGRRAPTPTPTPTSSPSPTPSPSPSPSATPPPSP